MTLESKKGTTECFALRIIARFFSVTLQTRAVPVGVALQNLIDEKSYERERFTMRMGAARPNAAAGRAVVGLYGQRGPPPCSDARAPIVVCSRGSQQKYCVYFCVALSEKSWCVCDNSVCNEYTLFVLAKWLGIHLTRGHIEGMDPPPANRPY